MCEPWSIKLSGNFSLFLKPLLPLLKVFVINLCWYLKDSSKSAYAYDMSNPEREAQCSPFSKDHELLRWLETILSTERVKQTQPVLSPRTYGGAVITLYHLVLENRESSNFSYPGHWCKHQTIFSVSCLEAPFQSGSLKRPGSSRQLPSNLRILQNPISSGFNPEGIYV